MSYSDPLPTQPSYAKNQHILEWWTGAHDELLVAEIEEKHWIWYWSIVDKIIGITPSETIATWRKPDPLCSQYAWYNVLMFFAAARAQAKGYTERIRQPEIVTCAACNKKFSEDSIPASIVRHLGINQIDICSNCIGTKFLQGSGNDLATREEVLAFIREIAEALEFIPPQDFGESLANLTHLSSRERAMAIGILERKPTVKRVKSLFGSWLGALCEAGVVEAGERKTARGTQCIARDGHICLSLGEKTIDDFLHSRHIDHEKEPGYPEGSYRADFKVDGILIEYFGLAGDPEYDARAGEKLNICRRHGIRLIPIYPKDLSSGGALT
jgi:hypothetical protein